MATEKEQLRYLGVLNLETVLHAELYVLAKVVRTNKADSATNVTVWLAPMATSEKTALDLHMKNESAVFDALALENKALTLLSLNLCIWRLFMIDRHVVWKRLFLEAMICYLQQTKGGASHVRRPCKYLICHACDHRYCHAVMFGMI